MVETDEHGSARAAATAENLRRSAVMVGLGETAAVLGELGLVEVVRANVERLNRRQGTSVALPPEPTRGDVERAAAALGVSFAELLR